MDWKAWKAFWRLLNMAAGVKEAVFELTTALPLVAAGGSFDDEELPLPLPPPLRRFLRCIVSRGGLASRERDRERCLAEEEES